MNEIEALKAELNQTRLAYYMAAQMSQFKAGFLARTSHELRSPLNSLIGLHQLIITDLCDSPEEEREFVSQAHQSALKLMKLIDEIVDVAKVEYGANPLELEPVSLNKIFDQLEDLTLLQAANSSIPLVITLPDPDLVARADSSRLLQALVSLVDTSIACMSEGSIKVSAQPDPETNSLQIAIDLQAAAEIWSEPIDLMQQAVPPTPEQVREQINSQVKTPSPGMRLWLSQTLLELMGGKLEVAVTASEEPATRLLCSIPAA